jgi:hypothetical protein
MTNRTWLGGGNNKASNPQDWSPAGAPPAGDALTLQSGTMDISGNELRGDALLVTGSADIYTTDNAALNLEVDIPILSSTVNVHADGTLKLINLTQDSSSLNISGDTLHFIGTSRFGGPGDGIGSTVLRGNLTGPANIDISAGNHDGIAVEIDGSVAHGLTFNLNAGAPLNSLQIDDPNKFHGLIQLAAPYLTQPTIFDFVDFVGIHATSARIHDDMLQMFDGKKLVDTTRLEGGQGLQLTQNSQGVILSSGYDYGVPGGAGTLIPLHIS